MTITNALSPARTQAFHSTMATQQKRGGKVQFSLPPVSEARAPAGGAAALSRNLLPIAVPIAALNGSVPATPLAPTSPTPATPGKGGPITTLPIAPSTPGSAIGTAVAGAVPNPGNMVSARLISRLYQQQQG